MHGNARLTPLVRAEIAHDVLIKRMTIRAAAAARMVSERTARRWVQRAKEEGLGRRLFSRSCVPIHQPRRTPAQLERLVVKLRRDRRTYAQILMLVPVSKATVSRILRRHGLNRLSALDPAPPPVQRYEWEHPGELLHLDIKKLGRFLRPGVRGTGNRADRSEGAGVEALHVAVDDRSRLAYACVLPDEKIPRVVAALEQAVSFFAFHKVRIQRVLTDRGVSYRSNAFAAACARLGIVHKFTRPYRPQTNGKAERFIQTITREWAYARSYRTSDERAGFLPHYIFEYNHHRPHSALNQKPPITRLPLCADNVSRHNR
ncbi:MAG: IS481 family transposase [Opitutaceae bacterium]|nr:IS481 family transposase [Opitutaceae bacterium]